MTPRLPRHEKQKGESFKRRRRCTFGFADHRGIHRFSQHHGVREDQSSLGYTGSNVRIPRSCWFQISSGHDRLPNQQPTRILNSRARSRATVRSVLFVSFRRMFNIPPGSDATSCIQARFTTVLRWIR